MEFKPGDKVWVKTLEELEKISERVEEVNCGKRYIFKSIGYDIIPEMCKYCGNQVTIKESAGEDLYLIEEDGDHWRWASCWLNKDKPSSISYVSDFGGTVEETTPAEVYWEQIMPQIKEIVINAYNKGVEIGKAEHI